MAVNIGNVYRDVTLRIDGQHYQECIFERCHIQYGGGPSATLIGNQFNGCTWTLVDAAARTLDFLGALQSGGGQALVQQILGRYGLIAQPAGGADDGKPG